MHFHLDAVQDIVGFAPTNVRPGEFFWALVRGLVTSDEPEFYKYVEQISNLFLNRCGVLQNAVYQFLVLIHGDSSAELYVNDFAVEVEILAKRDIEAQEVATDEDIADIRRLKFPGIQITDTDKLIYCFKVGWKFGLFLDLDCQERLDVDAAWMALGKLYRELSFQYVYEVLRSGTQFEEMMKHGWFPFIALLGWRYRALCEAYPDGFDFDKRIEGVVASFDRATVEQITARWWRKAVFLEKRELIEAGTNAFLRGDEEGYINCIKTLLPEAEGILRIRYFGDTGKGKDVSVRDLVQSIKEMGEAKSGSGYSLLLPVPFLDYLRDVVFAQFDLATGQIDLSRHSSSHGVAPASAYTRTRALQSILVLDQICYYL
ncbi:MAG: hypothetical protein SVP26_09075 [Chloroflexota bacterium]|nr:hypothetical protein [Chloroflexota bacterium]